MNEIGNSLNGFGFGGSGGNVNGMNNSFNGGLNTSNLQSS